MDNIIKSEFYQRVSELKDSLMDYIKENGPYSLDYNSSRIHGSHEIQIQEIVETKLGRIGDCEIEVTSQTVNIDLHLYQGSEWDTTIQITLDFYTELKDLFTPLLEVNLQEFKDNLERSLIPILQNFDKEEYTDHQIEDTINQVLDKATMWIKFNGYQLEWNREDKSIRVHLSDKSVQISLNLF